MWMRGWWIDRDARAHPVDQLEALRCARSRSTGCGSCRRPRRIDQPGVGDQLAQHHRDGLQRLDLDIGVAARLGMLDRQHADRALAADDRHAGEAVEPVLARFGAIGEVGVRRRLVEVQRLDILRDRADQPLAQRQRGDVDRLLVEPVGREQLQHALAQQVDRGDLAVERLGDDVGDRVELGLRAACAPPSRRGGGRGFRGRRRRR